MNLPLFLDSSPFRQDEILTRLAEARNAASREVNRFFLASLVFVGLTAVKISGLSLDLTLVGMQTANVPHGLFLFLVAAQICIMMSFVRTADVRGYDHHIHRIIERLQPRHAKRFVSTFPNNAEWFAPSLAAMAESGRGIPKFIFNIASFMTSFTAIPLYASPMILSCYVIYNAEYYIKEGNVELQYFTLIFFTFLSSIWFVAYIALHIATDPDSSESAIDAN